VNSGGLSVLIVAGIRLYREGLAALLPGRPDLVLAGTAACADEALAITAEQRPDLAIIDAGTSGARAIAEHIHRSSPGTRLLVFGVSEDEPEILSWASAGVTGYVTRDGSLQDLTAAIDAVMRDEVASTPRIASILLRRFARTQRADGAPDFAPALLTARERQILSLIELGLSNKDIAQRLNIEISTVKNHVHHLLQKLHVTSRAAAAARVRLASPR
jgi:DNA-binding NarL/FixJ family response regulator